MVSFLSPRLPGRSNVAQRFLRRYDSAITKTLRILSSEHPDYIVAVTRKSPRLLELIELGGFGSVGVPVLTERAIELLPQGALNDRKVVVFDDIVILGSSLREVLQRIHDRNPSAKLKAVSVAVDDEVVRAARTKSGRFQIHLKSDSLVELRSGTRLSVQERFAFCNSLVRALAGLNRPYDLDHPIQEIASLASTRWLEAIKGCASDFELTTVSQSEFECRRITAIPDQETLTNFVGAILSPGSGIKVTHGKLRLYVQSSTTRTVPIVGLEIPLARLTAGEIFRHDLSTLNALVEQARSLATGRYKIRATYGLINFLVEALFLQAIQRYALDGNRSEPPVRIPPIELRGCENLFGHDLAESILSALEGASTVWTGGRAPPAHREPFGTRRGFSSVRIPADLDNKTKKLYGAISPWLEHHRPGSRRTSDRVASVFEAMYREVETRAQLPPHRGKRRPIIAPTRFDSGFSLNEIASLVGLSPRERPDDALSLSLATDFLVDAGVQVPFIRISEDHGVVERAYRHGEDALSAKKLAFVIATGLDIFSAELLGAEPDDSTIPTIASEKVCLLLQEVLRERGHLDELREPLGDADDRIVLIAPHFLRHGRAIAVDDQTLAPDLDPGSELDSPSFSFMVEWARAEKILLKLPPREEFGEPRYKVNPGYISEQSYGDYGMPYGIELDDVGAFADLAGFCVQLYKSSPADSKDRLLIALTSCCDSLSYLEAIRADTRLLLGGGLYGIGPAALDLREALTSRPGPPPIRGTLDAFLPKDRLGRGKKRLNLAQGTLAAALLKQQLRRDLPAVISTVQDIARSSKRLSLNFKRTLERITRDIERSIPRPTPQAISDDIVTLEGVLVEASKVLEGLALVLAVVEHPDSDHADALGRFVVAWNASPPAKPVPLVRLPSPDISQMGDLSPSYHAVLLYEFANCAGKLRAGWEGRFGDSAWPAIMLHYDRAFSRSLFKPLSPARLPDHPCGILLTTGDSDFQLWSLLRELKIPPTSVLALTWKDPETIKSQYGAAGALVSRVARREDEMGSEVASGQAPWNCAKLVELREHIFENLGSRAYVIIPGLDRFISDGHLSARAMRDFLEQLTDGLRSRGRPDGKTTRRIVATLNDQTLSRADSTELLRAGKSFARSQG